MHKTLVQNLIVLPCMPFVKLRAAAPVVIAEKHKLSYFLSFLFLFVRLFISYDPLHQLLQL